uniref:Ig-like domain-containing protein n=1 Tax=Fundulus heteroclitus TaxID=8078 RepID=A0A3Q2SSI9_FUNHE
MCFQTKEPRLPPPRPRPQLQLPQSKGWTTFSSLKNPKTFQSQRSDSGLYRCVATNKHGEIELSNLNPGQEYLFRVTAINDKGKSDPKVLAGPVMTKDLLGQPAVMKCQIVGRPVPEIKWYHAGKEIVESRKYEMSSDGRNHSLSIMTDQQEDEGEYTCKAVNEAGEIETTGSLVPIQTARRSRSRSLREDTTSWSSLRLMRKTPLFIRSEPPTKEAQYVPQFLWMLKVSLPIISFNNKVNNVFYFKMQLK